MECYILGLLTGLFIAYSVASITLTKWMLSSGQMNDRMTIMSVLISPWLWYKHIWSKK